MTASPGSADRDVLFSIALLAYPRAFRRRFGDEMRDDFRRTSTAPGTLGTIGAHVANGFKERGSAIVRWVVLSELQPRICTNRQGGTSCSGTRCAPTSVTRCASPSRRRSSRTLTILALALGIGATTAIFAVVNGVLLQSLPYRDDGRLVNVWSYNTKENLPRNPLSPANFLDFQKMNTTLDGLEGYFTFVTPAQLQTDARHRDHLLAVRDPEHVQHARPLRRARPRVRARRRERASSC